MTCDCVSELRFQVVGNTFNDTDFLIAIFMMHMHTDELAWINVRSVVVIWSEVDKLGKIKEMKMLNASFSWRSSKL